MMETQSHNAISSSNLLMTEPSAPSKNEAADALMGVHLTECAAAQILRAIEKRGKGLGIRLGVKTTGCSGLAYTLEYVDTVLTEDLVFLSHEAKVFVNPKDVPYLDGTHLDYAKEGLNEGFRFTNPNEKDRCGCGESFRVKT